MLLFALIVMQTIHYIDVISNPFSTRASRSMSVKVVVVVVLLLLLIVVVVVVVVFTLSCPSLSILRKNSDQACLKLLLPRPCALSRHPNLSHRCKCLRDRNQNPEI